MRLAAAFASAAVLCSLLAWQTTLLADMPANEVAPVAALPEEAALSAAIDDGLAEVWRRDNVKPAPPSSDEEFLRRVYLDTLGLPPNADEARSFLADDADDKRERLIDALVEDKRFAEHVADQWVNVLMGRGRSQDNAELVLGAWMARQIDDGRGFADILYDIIAARGLMSENPAAAYFAGKRDFRTADIAGEAVRHFTGVQLQCAQCHDHPYEDSWTEQQFNGVAGFFVATQLRRNGNVRPRQGNVSDRNIGKLDPAVMQRRLATIKDDAQRIRQYEVLRYRYPRFLLGEPVKVNDARLWRRAWAQWVVADDNRQTQRYIANRFWSFLFGTGIVNPVDDFNSLNEASHPALLDALADDMRASGYNIRRLYRAVLKSRAWQASSAGATRDAGNGTGKVEAWHFAQYPVRQLSPEQFFGALLVASGHSDAGRRRLQARNNPYTRERAQGNAYLKRKEAGTLPANQRPIEWDFEATDRLEALIDTMSAEWYQRRAAARSYARVSSDDEMSEVDGFSLTMDQAMFLLNGRTTAQLAASSRGSLLEHIHKSADNMEGRIARMFLIVLARNPSQAELERYKSFLAQPGERQRWEDALYSLLLTTEFSTNH